MEARVLPHFCDGAAVLPRAFEETSLRLFLTERDPLVFERVREAFAHWCETRGLCNDECVVREAEKEAYR